MRHRLSETDLLADGPLSRLASRVFTFDQIDSTNAFLLARARELPDGAIAAAEFQSAGRGRHARQWIAPRGSSVMLSVLLLEPADSPLLAFAAMLASLAACEAIDQCSDQRAAVRWPNDLVLAQRKLGGVLAESTMLPSGGRAIVIGIGINCLQQCGHFENGLRDKATSLEIESSRAIDRPAIAARLLARLDQRLTRLQRAPDSVAEVLSTWKSRCLDVGTHVTLQHDGSTVSGTVIDIADDADLILELDHGGRRHFGAATTTRIW